MNYSEQFEQLWAIYPRKIGKALAYKKYQLAIKKGAKYDDIFHGVIGYKDYTANTDKQYIAHMATFINQERWLDNYSAETISGNAAGTGNKPRQGQISMAMACAVRTVQKHQENLRVEGGSEWYDS